MLKGFATLNIWADDVEAAQRWYADLLGIEPYFERPGPDGRVAYAEFRIGVRQDELGIIQRSWQPSAATPGPGGAIMHWHVDDLEATLARLLSTGAELYHPVTPRGEGFATASVIDPFGNILGVMTNPHFAEMSGRPA